MKRAKKTPRRAPLRSPLASLPVAKGRPRGKKCYVCGEVQDASEFKYASTTPSDPRPAFVITHRRCMTCAVAGRTRVFKHKCPACGKATESGSNRPTMCSDKCREKTRKNSEKLRAARRKSRASRRSPAET